MGLPEESGLEMEVQKEEQKVIVKSCTLENDAKEQVAEFLRKSFEVEEAGGELRGCNLCDMKGFADGVQSRAEGSLEYWRRVVPE